MTETSDRTSITGEVAAKETNADHAGLLAFLSPKQSIPLVFIVAAFVVGNILSPLYDHMIGPLMNAYVAARNDDDTVFIREFNTGLSGPQALNQAYLIGYFAREYSLAENTTKSIQNRCSVAQTIITYAQDPEIPQHASMLYAMPASVTDDVDSARAWSTEPWFRRMLAHDPSCFVRIGRKIDALRALALNPTTPVAGAPITVTTARTSPVKMHMRAARPQAPVKAGGSALLSGRFAFHSEDVAATAVSASSTVAAAVAPLPQTAASTTPTVLAPGISAHALPPVFATSTLSNADAPNPAVNGDWNTGPTPGSVVGDQMVKIFIARAPGGQVVHIRNTNLTGDAGSPVTVQLACRDCGKHLAFDPSITYTVAPVKSVHTTADDRLIFIPTNEPISFVWRAQEDHP